jgi:hypothetical protein
MGRPYGTTGFLDIRYTPDSCIPSGLVIRGYNWVVQPSLDYKKEITPSLTNNKKSCNPVILPYRSHSDTGASEQNYYWIPACAGMTTIVALIGEIIFVTM